MPPAKVRKSKSSKQNDPNKNTNQRKPQQSTSADSQDTRSIRSHSNSSNICLDESRQNDAILNTIQFCAPDGQSQAIILDKNLCRTLSMIVTENIKELGKHQVDIGRARMKLVNSDSHDSAYKSGNFITHNDILRLQVRDEQTKAIETIKQLNNYLGVTSTLKRQIELNDNKSLSEDVYTNISDLRANIIQALNDFVLANSDVDVPIIDTIDPNFREYDLCFDVSREFGSNSLTESQRTNRTDGNQSSKEYRNNEPLVVISDENFEIENSNQVIQTNSENRHLDLEKRRKEISKLERDTVELRKLFSDFYNLVKVQGETLDTIEDNIVVATHRVVEGRNNIGKVKVSALVPVTGCITGALIGGPIGFIVGGKIGTISIICATTLLGLLSSLGAQKCLTGKTINDHE